MSLLKNIRKNSVGIVLALSILSHIFLVNYNAAEWGDSYRILRAAQIMKSAPYPEDEKRPPLFSAILSLSPETVDPIFFGRLVMLVVGILSLVTFYFLAKKFIKSQKYLTLTIILFWLNPVYLYWSLRIYADVPFSLYVMAVVLAYYYLTATLTLKKSLLLGFLSAIGILIRFEGYLLLGALFAALVYNKQIKYFLASVGGSLFIIIPYFLYRNPLNSAYLTEPSRRSYDITEVYVFIISLFFLFGFLFAPAVFLLAKGKIWKTLKSNLFISFFILLSLALILMWPAAIPRLFVSIIPFLIILLVLGFEEMENSATKRIYLVLIHSFFIATYAISQYFLKLQFLIVLKPVFVSVVVINILAVCVFYLKRFFMAYALITLSCLIWAGATLYIHKNIYRSLSEASKYVSRTHRGLVLHNDINSVADWYLNYDPQRNKTLSGRYIKISDESDLDYSKLSSLNSDFVMISNEHDMFWQPKLDEILYLEEIRSFRYNVNSGNFFTGLYKIKN